VESFRPGVVDRLGIGYDVVQSINPKIVYCAITGYGQSGPYRERAGHDLNYCAYTGISDQMGLAQGPPAIPNIQFADLAGGALSAAMAILAALFDAARSGQGRYIDSAITDCTLATAIIPLAGHSITEGRCLGDKCVVRRVALLCGL
jgi:alpha-methylacyl-CoA racemase